MNKYVPLAFRITICITNNILGKKWKKINILLETYKTCMQEDIYKDMSKLMILCPLVKQ